MLKTWLAHPLTRGLNIDHPETTQLRQQIIQEKIFLKRIYQEWYRAIATTLPPSQGAVLELGAGGGFMREFVPNLITSELFFCPTYSNGIRWVALAVCSLLFTCHRDD